MSAGTTQQLHMPLQDRLCEYSLGSDGIAADIIDWSVAGQRVFWFCQEFGVGVLFYMPYGRCSEHRIVNIDNMAQHLHDSGVKKKAKEEGWNYFGHLVRETLLAPFLAEKIQRPDAGFRQACYSVTEHGHKLGLTSTLGWGLWY